MTEFRTFIEDLFDSMGVKSAKLPDEPDTVLAGIFLDKVNKFIYQRGNGMGRDYVSPFHRFWKEYHPIILSLNIDENQCLKVAQTIEPIFAHTDKYPLYAVIPPINRTGIPDKLVANVRFFTAIQDFKINIHKGGRNPFEQAIKTPEWFTASDIIRSPELITHFLQYLEATGSQGDKRSKWMLAAAQYLMDTHRGDAYNILEDCKGDAGFIREDLASRGYLGYSFKKADMFLRDMAEWRIWTYSTNANLIDVASDTNTMRIALRTGVIRTKFPLLASYLDVYCYQYSAVDELAAKGWRKTWELWASIPNNHRPPTPASMDYLLYQSIGKTFCRPTAKCSICLFDSICPNNTRLLNPPKSISQKGMTGWDSGITNIGGGGGIMS